METHAVNYPFYEDCGNMSNTYTDFAWLIGGHANARAEPVQQYDSTSALTAVTPVQSDAQNPQIVGYTERNGTDQRPYYPSDLGSMLVPLNNQSLATDTSHAISWSPDSLIQLTSCNPCNYTSYTPIDKLGDYPTTIDEVEQRVALERDDQCQQSDAYPTSTEGSLEGYNIVEGGLYNSSTNDFSNADIISAAFLPEVDGLSKSACIEARVDTSAAQSKKRKREVSDFAESPSSPNYPKRTQIHRTVAEVDYIKLPDGAFQCLMCDKVCSKIYGLKQHMNVAHSSERLYRCAPCGKRFVTRESLERHSLRHAPSDKAFKCQVCPKDYHRKSDLNRHIKEKHTGAPLGCHLCTRRYSRKDHLLKHKEPKRRGKPAKSRS
uniref:C2H2-type domain-containing protein n=1 Tax=Glossina pallidipes TaxID=7398 RepID=A0A1A9ZXC0_GLOPL